MTRVGIVGAGFMGANHARLLATEVTEASPCAIADVDRVRAEELAGRYDLRIHESAEDVIADPAVDAVLIAAPDVFHEPLALTAIAAGKPVMVEKPLAAAGGGRARSRPSPWCRSRTCAATIRAPTTGSASPSFSTVSIGTRPPHTSSPRRPF